MREPLGSLSFTFVRTRVAVKMYARTVTYIRMLIGILAGILVVGAWGVLALGALEGIFGGQVNITWLVLGLMMLIGGPVLLGLSNNRLSRALLAGLLAPVVALVLSGGWSVLLSILEHLSIFLPFGRATTLAIVNIAVLVGTTELLTRQPFKAEASYVLRGTGLALCIAFGFELLRNVVLIAIIAGPISEPEWMSWLIITVYTVLTGANIVYLEGACVPRGDRPSILATVMFLAFNSLALVIIVIATALVTRAQ